MIKSVNLEQPADNYSNLLGEVENHKRNGWDLYGILTINQPGGKKVYRATLNRFEP